MKNDGICPAYFRCAVLDNLSTRYAELCQDRSAAAEGPEGRAAPLGRNWWFYKLQGVLSLLWHSCIDDFTLKDLCTALVSRPSKWIFRVAVEHLRTLLPLHWFSTGTGPFCHSQDILENGMLLIVTISGRRYWGQEQYKFHHAEDNPAKQRIAHVTFDFPTELPSRSGFQL